MTKSKWLIVSAAVLGVLAVAVWAFAIVGVMRGGDQTSEVGALQVEPPVIVEVASTVQTTEPAPEGEDVQVDVSEETAFEDLAGVWDLGFVREFWEGPQGQGSPYTTMNVTGEFDIAPGQDPAVIEVFFRPLIADIDGAADPGTLVDETILLGEFRDQSLILYFDPDNFYYAPQYEAIDTVEPDYIEIPLMNEGGVLHGRAQRIDEIEIGGAMVTSVVHLEVIQR